MGDGARCLGFVDGVLKVAERRILDRTSGLGMF